MGRELKKEVSRLLSGSDFKAAIEGIGHFPARQVINPLLGLFCSRDELLRWRAVSAAGRVVSDLALKEPESARVVMRRLMWTLNDESGGIGWGAPEAMGEIMTLSPKMAGEFHCILISYVRTDGNFLEHPLLQHGLLWGLGRLAHARPDLVMGAARCIVPFMAAEHATARGLAAWTIGALDAGTDLASLESLANDTAELKLYRHGELSVCTVGELARQALAGLESRFLLH